MSARFVNHFHTCLFAVVVGTLLVSCATPPAAQRTTTPTMRITAPVDGSKVKGPKITFEVAVDGYTLTTANQVAKEGEGHLHFFIDVPASSVPVGQGIPLDQPKAYVHAGKEPFTSRALELAPGKHTITVVMANSVHQVVAQPQPVSVTVEVE